MLGWDRLKKSLLVLSLWAACGQVSALELVSAHELQASMAAAEPLNIKSTPVPDAPRIEVLHPRLDAPVISPTPIELVFITPSSSTVRPETFKVLYGRLRIDITPRLLSAAKVTSDGIHVKEASLPKGVHRLLLSVEDLQGRQGIKSLDFEIK